MMKSVLSVLQLETLDDMIEEVQREARYCMDPQDTAMCMAKRDALSELSMRLRVGRENHQWARQRPILLSLP